MKGFLFFVTLCVISLGLVNCNRLIDSKRISSKYDSLVLDVRFGMERKEFFDYCWEMNRQKILTHGPTNQNVEYEFQGVKDKIIMRFYPSFYEERVYELPVTYTYQAWAPWNKEYDSEHLLVEILDLYKRVYGNDFKSIVHPTMGEVFYKFDKYRRINIFLRDEQFVQVVFSDMRVLKQLKKEYESEVIDLE
ncbi:MAG: hypothetical protein J0L66_02400 [Cytophagales bacterium]|nr:hypothetical protein [Cytophagales bacterium]